MSDEAFGLSLATVAVWRCIWGQLCLCVDTVYICKYKGYEETELLLGTNTGYQR